MKLKVKQGREFTQGGKTYRGGDEVEVPDKFAVALTQPRAPLEQLAEPVRKGRGARYNRRDMRAEQ